MRVVYAVVELFEGPDAIVCCGVECVNSFRCATLSIKIQLRVQDSDNEFCAETFNFSCCIVDN